MKRIISFLMAAVMILSLSSITVFADIDTTIPDSISIVTKAPVEITADEYESATFVTLPGDYTAYKVEAGLSGTGGVNGTNGRNAIGKMISNFSYFVDFENIENLLTGDDIYVTDGTYTNAIVPSDGGDAWVKDGSGVIYRYGFVSNNMFPGKAVVEYQDSELSSLVTMYFAIKTGTSVKAIVSTDSGACIGNYTTSGSQDMKTYSPTLGTITLSPASFTLGTPAQEGPTVEKADDKTAAGITGYTVSTLAEQKVLVSEKLTNQKITEATRLHVTYNGETRVFGSDLYSKLNGTGGEITIGSLTFGLIVNDSAVAADFTFELK